MIDYKNITKQQLIEEVVYVKRHKDLLTNNGVTVSRLCDSSDYFAYCGKNPKLSFLKEEHMKLYLQYCVFSQNREKFYLNRRYVLLSKNGGFIEGEITQIRPNYDYDSYTKHFLYEDLAYPYEDKVSMQKCQLAHTMMLVDSAI